MRQILSFTFFVLSSLFLSCSGPGNMMRAAGKELRNDSLLQHAHLGISIFEPSTGKYLYQYQPERYFIPASNTKLFTLYAGLRFLGDSITGLEYAHIDSALWIRPAGDPSFLHPLFPDQPVYEFLSQATRQKVMVQWPEILPAMYGSGWQVDDLTKGETLPRSAFPVWGHVPMYSSDDMSAIELRADNGYASTQFLSDTLHKNIVLNPGTTQLTWKKFKSRPSDSLFIPMMKLSDNFIAEQILLMAARERTGVMQEERLIDSLLHAELSGIPQKPRWVDGSGASRYNLFTPSSMVYILDKMRQEFGMQRMQRLLPTGGQGTLLKYYHSISGQIFAKTGTLSNNQALSGYLITRKGRLYIFSIMINHYLSPAKDVRVKVEKFLTKVWAEN